MAARFVDLAQVPVPSVIAPTVAQVIKITREQPTSFYRGSDPAGTAILHKHGHHNQAELYFATPAQRAAMGVIGTPDRPNTSTHECRSDGVAFKGPVGRVIPDYQCGQDWPNASIAQVMAAYRSLGELPIHPYSSGDEYHHICLVDKPGIVWATLERGDKGGRVLGMTEMLVHTGDLTRRWFHYTNGVRNAVAEFQRRHHLQVDGKVGMHTIVQLRAANRACLKRHRPEVKHR